MASPQAVRLFTQIYEKVDKQVRDIVSSMLPDVNIAAQDDGAVIANDHRIVNFQGDGVVVTDEPSLRRVDVFIPGAPAASSTSTVFSTTAAKAMAVPTVPCYDQPVFTGGGSGYFTATHTYGVQFRCDVSGAQLTGMRIWDAHFGGGGATVYLWTPTGTLLTSWSVSVCGSSVTDCTVDLSPPYNLTSGTSYMLGFDISGVQAWGYQAAGTFSANPYWTPDQGYATAGGVTGTFPTAPQTVWWSFAPQVCLPAAGGPPTDWQTPGYNDSAWSAAVASSVTSGLDAIFSASNAIWNASSASSATQQALTRQTFTLPAGTIATATLQLQNDDYCPLGVYVNGHLVGGSIQAATSTGSPRTFDIPPSQLTTGGSNLIAASGSNNHPALVAWIAYKLTVNYLIAGVDSRYQLLSEKNVANGYAGLDAGVRVPTARLGSGSASSSTFLRGDQTWAAGGSGMSDPMTTAGDMIYRDGSNVTNRLGVGSSGQVLTVSSGAPAWAAASGMSNPMTTQDDIIVGGSSGTPGRLAKGSDGQVLTIDSSSHHVAWATPSAGGGGGLLGYNLYNPGTASTYTTNSNSVLVDVDATNMAVTFTAPASGRVLVRLTAQCTVTTTTGFPHAWGLRSGSTTMGNPARMTNVNSEVRLSAPFIVTGLTPSTSYTFKWAYCCAGGSNNCNIPVGGAALTNNGGPAIMEVWSA